MRTPLNSACMGLELMHESYLVKAREDPSTEAILDDVIESCDSAVTILNELLIFEKLESKSLGLNLKRIPPLPFLTEVLRPFIAQVIGAGGRLSFFSGR